MTQVCGCDTLFYCIFFIYISYSCGMKQIEIYSSNMGIIFHFHSHFHFYGITLYIHGFFSFIFFQIFSIIDSIYTYIVYIPLEYLHYCIASLCSAFLLFPFNDSRKLKLKVLVSLWQQVNSIVIIVVMFIEQQNGFYPSICSCLQQLHSLEASFFANHSTFF